MNKKGILLVNLGTPNSPLTRDVKQYLNEFLMDGRVIDVHPIIRTILVKGLIVPFRGPKSAKLYQEIWSDKTGSPLKHYSLLQTKLLQERLGDSYHVELAMRYQNPSISSALEKLRNLQVDSIKVIPLFPQYASASTGSVLEKVMHLISCWPTIPPVSFVNSFHDHELMIETFVENGRKHQPHTYDHILFSFHGLPEKQLKNSDYSQQHCLQKTDCCNFLTKNNKFCYSAQSYATAHLIAEKLGINRNQYTVCFQSRLGKDPWVKPYTNETIKQLAIQGTKRLLVFCPAFVSDCLETIYEVSVEYNHEFQTFGGEHIQLVESLNDHPKWITALEQLVKEC